MSEAPRYLDWLRLQPCAQCARHAGGTEAHHHTGRRGAGQKAADKDAFPLCHDCHMAFHDGRGFARDWTHGERTAWQDKQVKAYWEAWLLLSDTSLF